MRAIRRFRGWNHPGNRDAKGSKARRFRGGFLLPPSAALIPSLHLSSCPPSPCALISFTNRFTYLSPPPLSLFLFLFHSWHGRAQRGCLGAFQHPNSREGMLGKNVAAHRISRRAIRGSAAEVHWLSGLSSRPQTHSSLPMPEVPTDTVGAITAGLRSSCSSTGLATIPSARLATMASVLPSLL